MKVSKFKITGNIKLLLILYISIFVLLVNLGLMVVKLTHQSIDKYDEIADNATRKLALLIGIRKNADYIQVATMQHAIDTSVAEMYAVEKNINKERAESDTNFSKYNALIDNPVELALFNKVMDAKEKNIKARDYLIKIDYLYGNDNRKPLEYLKNVQQHTYNYFQNSITALSNYLTINTYLKIDETGLFVKNAKLVLNICLGMIILILIVLGYLIRLTINKLQYQNKELKESELLYRSLFNNMLNGYAYCKMIYNQNNEPIDWTFLHVNNAYEKLTGLYNVTGKKVTEVIPGIYNSSSDLFSIYSRVAMTGIHEQFESYVKELDMWFSVSVYSSQKGYFTAIFDVITERKRTEESRKILTDELRTLAAHLENAREEERKTIAKDIHDELGQNLTVSKIDIAWIIRHIDDDKPKLLERLEQLNNITKVTIDTSRRLYNNIYPRMIEDVGLPSVIQWNADNYLIPNNILFSLVADEDKLNLDHNICLVLFRIYQECCTNILKHAKATNVLVDLHKTDDNIVISIKDDGIGFDTETVNIKDHYGLLGMRERTFALNGTLNIESVIGKGTVVTASIPIKEV